MDTESAPLGPVEGLPHAVRLRSTWKATPSEAASGWAVDLGETVLLVGPNGSRKSRVPEALSLVLTGEVPSLLGREKVKDPAFLWRAKAAKAETLWVEADLSDGRTIRWEQSKPTQKTPPWTVQAPDGSRAPIPKGGLGAVLGVAEVRESLFGSAEKAEAWLASRIGLTAAAVLAQVESEPKGPATTKGTVASIGKTLPKGASTETLLATFTTQRKAADEALTLAERNLTQVEEQAGPPVTEDDIATAKADVIVATRASEAAAARQEAYADLASCLPEYRKQRVELDGLPALDPAVLRGVGTARSILGTLDTVLGAYPANDKCPCCKTSIGTGALQTRREGLVAYLESAEGTARAADRRRSLEESVVVLAGRIRAAKVALLPTDIEAMKAGAWIDPTTATDEALATAKDTLDLLLRRRTAAQAPGMAQDAFDKAKARRDLYAAAESSVEKAVSSLLKDRTRLLNEAIARFFPPTLGTPVVRLRPKVEVGLDCDGVVGIPSGGEEAALLLAFGAVFAQAATLALKDADGKAVPYVLTLDDRAFDAETLAAILAVFVPWDAGQVIVQSTTSPTVVPASWTVIVCGAEKPAPVIVSSDDDSIFDEFIAEAEAEEAVKAAAEALEGTASERSLELPLPLSPIPVASVPENGSSGTVAGDADFNDLTALFGDGG